MAEQSQQSATQSAPPFLTQYQQQSSSSQPQPPAATNHTAANQPLNATSQDRCALGPSYNTQATTHVSQSQEKCGPTATAHFLQDFNLVAEAAKRAQMAVVMRDLENVSL